MERAAPWTAPDPSGADDRLGWAHAIASPAPPSSEGEDWHATFEWDGSRGDVAGAELELGRSLVVELPPPRRRRRRRGATAEVDLRLQLEDLRATVAELTLERDRLLDSGRDPTTSRADCRPRRARSPRATRRGRARSPPSSPPCATTDDDDATSREALAAAAAARAEAEAARADAERIAGELSSLRAKQPAAEELEALREDAASARAEADRLTERLSEAEARGEANAAVVDELAGLRLAHGSLKAAHERLEDELEELRAIRDERDEAVGRLTAVQSDAGDEERQRAALGDVIRELQERTTAAEDARERLEAELAVAREDITRLQGLLAEREEALTEVEADIERRVESERAATTEVHERLADAREEAQRSMVAEAEETERLRAELERTREDAEKLLAAERAEVARLREELLNSEVDETAEESSRRMVERMTRDLDRERATTRTLRRELEALRADSAEHRRGGQRHALDRGGAGAAHAGRPRARGRPWARSGASTRPASHPPNRVPRNQPSQASLWIVRVAATIFIAICAIALRDLRSGDHVVARCVRSAPRSCSPLSRCCCRGRWRSTRGRGWSGGATSCTGRWTRPPARPGSRSRCCSRRRSRSSAARRPRCGRSSPARAGCSALYGAFVLADRLAGRWAGAAAVAAMALSPWWLFNTALGNSEGLLAAAVLWAVIAHLDGHHRAALALATAAALMRPEAWPFLFAYGVWLWREDRQRGARRGARWSRCCGSARTSSARAARSARPTPRAASRPRAARSSPTSPRSPSSATPRRSSRSPRWSSRSSPRRSRAAWRAGSRWRRSRGWRSSP